MWRLFMLSIALLFKVCLASSSGNIQNDFSFEIEQTSSGFPTYAYAFRALILKRKQIIAWANYYFLYQDQAKKEGYDVRITFLQAFNDEQAQKRINDIVYSGKKSSESPLDLFRKKCKLTEVLLVQQRGLLLRSMLSKFSEQYKEIHRIAVEIPHGCTKEAQFYKSFGFELTKTLKRKSGCSSKKNEGENYLEVGLFIKKLRK